MKKTMLLLSATLFACSFATFAQKDSSGVYLTVDDYKAGTLSYPINYRLEKQKIKDHLFLQASQVKVKHNGETHLLDKNNLYGYRNSRGQDFRFVGDRAYRILNAGDPIILYKYGEPQADPIKNPPVQMNRYYFSTNETNSPVNLTRRNLKAAFPDNKAFQDAIDKNFRSDDELTRLDKGTTKYTIVRLLENSMPKQ